MAKIASTAEIAAKWAAVTPARSADFQKGVQDTTVDWAGPTAAAEPAYSAGVQAAAAEGRFSRGVTKAGTSKWRTNTLSKGVARWGQGVAAGAAAFQAGFSPYQAVIANTTLPPRMARGNPQNIDRVRILAAALHDAKTKS